MSTINELRFVERDGKRILQQYKETKRTFVNIFGRICFFTEWQDVPFISNEELQR